jgi:uncharacterized protein involved in cysteine biosynthesis
MIEEIVVGAIPLTIIILLLVFAPTLFAMIGSILVFLMLAWAIGCVFKEHKAGNL